MPSPRPVLDDDLQSNIPGLYVIGDLAGAPVVKLAMEQGYKVARHLLWKLGETSTDASVMDVLVIGAGAAGLNAALELHQNGLRVLVLEKNRIGSTVAGLPAGKWIYTEPDDRPVIGSLSLQECTKEDLVELWEEDVRRTRLPVQTGEAIASLTRSRDGVFVVGTSTKQEYKARAVILAVGKSGSPRKLGVAGENLPHVDTSLYSPKVYRNQDILVVGGGNSAVEAAIALAEQNRVTLSYRGSEFHRITKENARQLHEGAARGSIEIRNGSEVESFGVQSAVLDGRERRYDHVFVLIGSEPPRAFLHSLGLRLENDWTGRPGLAAGLAVGCFLGLLLYGGQSSTIATLACMAAFICAGMLLARGVSGDRFALLGFTFVTCYTIYGAKQAAGHEFWPFTGWGFHALSFFNRPWSFWYTVLYTFVMTVFGIQAMKRWGLNRKDKFQTWRYVSLLGFQWIFFFLIPEFLFQWAVKFQWLGDQLAADPNFAQNAWRSYGIVYAWPLFFYTFFGSPHQIWIVWGAVLSFVIVPVLVLFHGKRYCSWICGCGGLAETLGDRWRHLAPKGTASIRWEQMNIIILAAAVVITVLMVTRDVVVAFARPAEAALVWYRLIADVWLVGILPVTLYPFFGGKVWCRYWCPLAKMMEIFSWVFTRFRVSRFAIQSNDKCIACGDCTRNCQVGIDVMRYALKQEELTNANSSCIGCGICVTVCPMDVLSFARPGRGKSELVQISRAA